MESFPEGYAALVIGAAGGIGSAISASLAADPRCRCVVESSRRDGLDLTDEASIEDAARRWKGEGLSFSIVFDATGALIIDDHRPEKTIRSIDPQAMAAQFAINAIGPALLIKHLVPLLDRRDRAVFATLSARVGSIGDNRLGGWISYRAAKAALNQIVRTASIEVQRSNPNAVLVALHPGTVATRLSDPFAGNRERMEPTDSAQRLLTVIDGLPASASGGFFAYDGSPIPW